MNLFITGIGTNVGKTMVSAILVEALQADYWKPIQSGVVDGKDSDTVKLLISNTKTIFHPETYLLKEPLSPHFAAKLDGIEIELDKIQLPKTINHLIIEGAGGLLVPINDTQYVIDIAKQVDCEIVLVISSYLGCINHSLLSIDYLLRNQFKLKALVFNGEFEPEVKQAIVNYCPDTAIIDIPTLNMISKSQIGSVSAKISTHIAL
ncbi:MAG: dethiobiotin synthase [Bacteroidia bacterium]|nr:dethiobiotin synthase [Bacteroidia bacterium]